MLPFSTQITQPQGTNYVVEFLNKNRTPIFRFETADWSLAKNLEENAITLFYKWQEVRTLQTSNSGWPTFAILCDAMYFPTRTGAHAVIYTEIENAYL